ncbi:MAG: amidohydrolase family protein, partial [Planctomycetota bacterium]
TGKIKGGGQEISFVAVRIDEEEKAEPVAKETKKKKKKVKKNESLEPYRPILAGKAPLVVKVTSRDAAEAAIQAVVVESKLRLVLTGAARELAKKPLELPGGKEIGFLLGVQELGYEEKGDYVDVATALADQGFDIILANRVQKGTRYLPVHAAYAVSTGFDPRRALESITGAAARSFGLEERIGLLARGRDADLVLLSGDPFDLPTRVLGVWVNGVLRVDRRANANPKASGEKR